MNMASSSEGGLVLVAVDGSEFSDRALHCKYSLSNFNTYFYLCISNYQRFHYIALAAMVAYALP
jgi:hypothetical protein